MSVPTITLLPMGHGTTLTRAFALELATTIHEAWHELLFGCPARHGFDHWRGVALFERFPGHCEPEALLTALLVCTDRRWRSCTHRLVRGIEQTGILPGDKLDEVARRFIEEDSIEVQLRKSGPGRPWSRRSADRSRDPCAAGARRGSCGVGMPCARSSTGRSSHAAAVVVGVLDAAEALDDTTAASVIDVGLEWPHSSVGPVALALVAQRNGPAAATARASNGPDAKVRRFGAKLGQHGRQPQLVESGRAKPQLGSLRRDESPNACSHRAGRSSKTGNAAIEAEYTSVYLPAERSE